MMKIFLSEKTSAIQRSDNESFLIYNTKTRRFVNQKDFVLADFDNKITVVEFLNIFTFIKIAGKHFLITIEESTPVTHDTNLIRRLNIYNLDGKCSLPKRVFDFIQNFFNIFCSENLLYYGESNEVMDETTESFLWNFSQLQTLSEQNRKIVRPFLPKIMSGYYAEKQIGNLKLIAVAKRASENVGPRFLHRKIDKNANSANFVVTEHFLEFFDQKQAQSVLQSYDCESSFEKDKKVVVSLKQLRGCVPLNWRQKAKLLRKPILEVVQSPQDEVVIQEEPNYLFDQVPVIKKSNNKKFLQNLFEINKVKIKELLNRNIKKNIDEYGPVIVIDLLSKGPTKSEYPLHKNWKTELKDIENVEYVHIDVSALLKANNWDWNILDGVYHNSMPFQDFAKDKGLFIRCDGKILSKQNGFFRVNCCDSTDRTALLNHYIVLQNFKPFLDKEGKKKLSEVNADMANALSRQYTQTETHISFLIKEPKKKLFFLWKMFKVSYTRNFFDFFTSGFRDDVTQLCLGKVNISLAEIEGYRNFPENTAWSFIGRAACALVFGYFVAKWICSFLPLKGFTRMICFFIMFFYLFKKIVMDYDNKLINLPNFDKQNGQWLMFEEEDDDDDDEMIYK